MGLSQLWVLENLGSNLDWIFWTGFSKKIGLIWREFSGDFADCIMIIWWKILGIHGLLWLNIIFIVTGDVTREEGWFFSYADSMLIWMMTSYYCCCCRYNTWMCGSCIIRGSIPCWKGTLHIRIEFCPGDCHNRMAMKAVEILGF